MDQHTRTSIQKPPPVCSASLRIMTAALGSSGSSSASPLSHLTHGNLVHIQSLELESGALWLTSQEQIVFFSSAPQCHSLTVIPHSHPHSLRNHKWETRAGREGSNKLEPPTPEDTRSEAQLPPTQTGVGLSPGIYSGSTSCAPRRYKHPLQVLTTCYSYSSIVMALSPVPSLSKHQLALS